jgi:ABC-type antimicrobial peptide transport system permease subunit
VLVSGGAVLGIGLAKLFEFALGPTLTMWAPGFAIDARLLVEGLLLTIALGIVSGIAPALRAARLMPVTALREDA